MFGRSHVFPARYGGMCGDCGHSIHVGDLIEMSEGQAVHRDCPDLNYGELVITADPASYGDVCPDCRLRHRGECL